MKVKELIQLLQKMPQEARVFHLWDGEPRTEINIVYESRVGHVITADYNEDCYSTQYMPKDEIIMPGVWCTPSDPMEDMID